MNGEMTAIHAKKPAIHAKKPAIHAKKPARIKTPSTPIVNRVLLARIIFIVTVVVLLLFGLMMVYSASSIIALREKGDAAFYFIKQIQFVGLGLVVAVILAFINYRRLNGVLSWLIWGLVVALLIYTLIDGFINSGAQRWIEIAGFNLQPGELAKIAMLLVCTHLITKLHESGSSNVLLAAAACGVFIPVLLLLAQPDLGTAVIALVGVIIVMWLGGIPFRFVLTAVGILIVLGAFAIAIEGFRQSRFLSFLDPWASPLEDGYQVINSFYAFAEGGILGVGIGQSHQKFFYLPEAQNDFIFAIIGEELGLIGALATAILFLVLVFSALMIARNAPDVRGRMLAGTAAALIGFQAFLNMMCVIGWAPITGKPLPFISAGGTSMISSMILVGLILSVSFHTDAREAAVRRRDNLVIIDGGRQAKQAAKPAGSPAARPAMGSTMRSGAIQPQPAPNQPQPRRNPSAAPLSLSSLSRNRTGFVSRNRADVSENNRRNDS